MHLIIHQMFIFRTQQTSTGNYFQRQNDRPNAGRCNRQFRKNCFLRRGTISETKNGKWRRKVGRRNGGIGGKRKNMKYLISQ